MGDLTCTSCGVPNPEDKLACTACGADLPHPTLRPPSTDLLKDDPAPDKTDSVKVAHTPNQLGGRYQLKEVLGEGGWGQVYRAYDTKLKEEIAIKILRSSLSTTPGEIERFKREIITARKITHPNVIRIHEYGEAGPDVYISMELLEGGTLADRLAEGKISIRDALSLATELAEGLKAAHDRDIIHRDIKPQNIMFDSAGNVKLVDFGIARLQGTQTQTQGFTGTPFYMSPEQADGSRITQASDIYSLGVVLFEIFTGQLPFRSDSLVRMALLHSTQKAPRPRSLRKEIPDFVEEIVLRCLEKKPEHRPANAGELANALRASLTALNSGGRPAPVLTPRKRRAVWPVVAAGVVLLGVGGAFAVRALFPPAGNATPTPGSTAVGVQTGGAVQPTQPAGVVTVTATVTVAPKATRTPRVVATRRPPPPAKKKGTVSVKITPHGWWSVRPGRKININLGENKNTSTRKLPVGSHTITVHNNYLAKSKQVTIRVCHDSVTKVTWKRSSPAPTIKNPVCD